MISIGPHTGAQLLFIQRQDHLQDIYIHHTHSLLVSPHDAAGKEKVGKTIKPNSCQVLFFFRDIEYLDGVHGFT